MAPSVIEPKITLEQTAFKKPSNEVHKGFSPYSDKAEGPSVFTTLPKPLEVSGALDEKYEFSEVTPNIGREYRTAQISDILKDDELLRDLAITISRRGVVFFRNQDLSIEEQKEFAHRLGVLTGKPKTSRLHIHPVTPAVGVLKEDGSNETDPEVTVISTKANKIIYKPEENDKLWSSGSKSNNQIWHSDITFEPVPADYTTLKIIDNPPSGGDTLWASGYAIYEKISPSFRAYLDKLTGTYRQPGFQKAAKGYGFELYSAPRGAPENIGDDYSAVHPIIRTNPVTGWKSVFAIGGNFTHFNDVSKKENDFFREYLDGIVLDNHDIQLRFKWGKNDLAVWDNRSVSHAATGDYKGDRTGVRTVGIGERPYFDPNSKSRSEDLKATGKTW